MPSFLNKVFGYKKHDDKEVARPARDAPDGTVLLDGKYEAIPPASTFADAQPAKDTDRDLAFSLFKPKSRGVAHKLAQRLPGVVPHLTLQLPGPKDNPDSRALGVVFEADPDSQLVLDDAAIAAKRLSPLEAVILIRACAQAITERGLETLGIMHPHWLSASPDVQRKLISLFIRSLTHQSKITTLFPTPSAPTSAFENELHYTRSPHDVAAVLRWGLRHLTLENDRFSKDTAEWAWYNTFFHAERSASYPPKAFSELLLPQLPASHVELLTATLGLISSLASHAEINSISGSKLSKFFGVWLLVATQAEESDDWSRFYARWERAGRILEHLFLARLREESLGLRLPTRLQELVKYYPYDKGSPTMEVDLLSRPRFSTRQYDALCVRVETVLTHSAEQPKQHPIQLLLDAFQLPIENPSGDEHIALWNTLKTTASEEATSPYPQGPQVSRIFVDETIQLLSLIPAGNSATSPTLLASPITKVISRKRSSSLSKVLERAFPKSNAHNGSTPVSPTSPSSAAATDWIQFSLSGFGDTPTTQPLVALLNLDDDIEITQPQISRKSSRRRGKSQSRRRRSRERTPSDTQPSPQHEHESSIVETKIASVHVVQLDEAFIDFWSDAIVDPISSNWPTFVLCGLKEIPSAERAIRWLVIEQTYSHQQPESPRNPSPDGRRGRSPRPSFKSDISGFRINSMFSSARKRFSVFSKSATDLDLKKSGGKTPTTGELGEILVEEEPTFPSAPPTKADQHVDGNAAVGVAATIGTTADTADQLTVNEISTLRIIPPTDLVSALEEASDLVDAVAKAPSVEPSPQCGAAYDGPSGLPCSSVEQGSPRTLGFVNPKVDNAADPLTRTTPVAADTPDSRTDDIIVLTSGRTAENSVAEDEQIQTEPLGEGVVVTPGARPVELIALPADSDEHLPAEPSTESSNVVHVDVTNDPREVAEIVAMPPAPRSVAVVMAKHITPSAVVTAVDDEPIAKHVNKQPSRQAPAHMAASAAGSVVVDHLPPLSATDAQHRAIATETRTQLEPNSSTSVVDGAEEAMGVAELAEIPTPGPELVALVEETPGQEVCADVYGRAEAAQVPEALDYAAPQPVATELLAALEAEESSITHPTEAFSVVIVPAVDTSARVVPVEAEHAADQVSELAAEEERPSVYDTIVQSAEALLAPEVDVDVSPGIVSTTRKSVEAILTELDDQITPVNDVFEAGVVEILDIGAPTPVLGTPGLEIATEEHAPVDTPPAIAPVSEAVEGKVVESIVQATQEVLAPAMEFIPLAEEGQLFFEAELSTQVLTGSLLTVSIPESATAALATVDQIVAVNAVAQPIPDASADNPEAHTPVPEGSPVEDTLEIAVEANTPEHVEVAPSAAIDLEPVIDEARVLVGDAVAPPSEPAANAPTVIIEEPVVHDVQAPAAFEAPSSEPAPQSTDGAVHLAVDTAEEALQAVDEPAPLVTEIGVPVDEIRTVSDARGLEALAAELEFVEAGAPAPAVEDAEEPSSVVVGVPEEGAASQLQAAPTVVIDGTSRVVEPQEGVDAVAEPSVTSQVDVSTREPAGPSEGIVPAEP